MAQGVRGDLVAGGDGGAEGGDRLIELQVGGDDKEGHADLEPRAEIEQPREGDRIDGARIGVPSSAWMRW